MKVFESLNEAIRQGYELYDRLPAGYLVRTALYDRWAFALVVPPVEAYGFAIPGAARTSRVVPRACTRCVQGVTHPGRAQ